MLGVFVNVAAILLGSVLGRLFARGIPERVSKAVMDAVGLCVAMIGVSGALKSDHTLLMVLSLVCGTVCGTFLDLDGLLTRFGVWVQRRLTGDKPTEPGKPTIAEGFVNATLIFCVGAMAIVGSLNSGLSGDHTMLYTKALLDGITSMMISVTLGIGVALSAASVLAYQGAIVLLAKVLAPLLSEGLITDLGAVGSLLIIVIGTNMIGITKIKTADLLPAVLFVPLFACFLQT